MAVQRLNILHLYPENMNLYGDRGNVLALSRRASWRNIPSSVINREIGESIEWDDVDMVFMGGGEDQHQERIVEDFLRLAPALCARLADGLPMLTICGAYQLLGQYYETAQHERLPGAGFLDVWTEAGHNRAIGDVVSETTLDLIPNTLVGFENHGGRTFLAKSVQPLGRVRLGRGNNGQDGTEGAVKDHVVGTYLHGSLLPKNPHLADLFVVWALQYRGAADTLEPLNEQFEMQAHQVIVDRGASATAKRATQ